MEPKNDIHPLIHSILYCMSENHYHEPVLISIQDAVLVHFLFLIEFIFLETKQSQSQSASCVAQTQHSARSGSPCRLHKHVVCAQHLLLILNTMDQQCVTLAGDEDMAEFIYHGTTNINIPISSIILQSS